MDEFYYRILGTTYRLRTIGDSPNPNEGGHRCAKGQGENIIYIMEQ